jgi:polyisoprenoid-binding protein YceI
MRTRTRWIIAVVAAVVVVVVAGPFIYIHFIEGKAPAKLALSTTAGAPGGSAPSVNGTWTVTPGSEAGYRVGEVIFGQTNTAVGRTSVITGSVTVSGTSVESGSFTADLTAVHSDQSQRDNQFQHRIMDTSKYPTAMFVLTKPINLGAMPAVGTTITATAAGDLTLHGTTRPVTVPVTARGSELQVLGTIPVVFADYSIPSPSLAGVVTTQDHGVLEFLLDFTKGTAQLATSPTTASTTPATGGPNRAADTAYRACLSAHGVTLPAPGAGGGPPGSGPPPGGGPGGAPPTPQMQAAQAACASLRPSGGFGRPTISPTTVPPLGL